MEDKELNDLLKATGLKAKDFNSIETLTDSFIGYARDIEKKKVNLGFPLVAELTRGLRTQELLTVIAGTGIGKSALILNFLMNYVKNTNELTVLFSLEMSDVGIAERIFQIELDYFGFEIENGFVKNDSKFIQQCRDLQSSLNNFIVINNRVDVQTIPAVIKYIEANKNRKVRLIGIDYVGLMDNLLFQKDEYLRVSDNMKKLYSYAKILDIAIINLSQTSRADVKANPNGLSIYSAKSSGEVENSSDFVLTLEKQDLNVSNKTEQSLIDKINFVLKFNDNRDKATQGELDLLKLSIHKNRRGKSGIIYTMFDRKNLRIKEFSYYNEKEKINEIIQEKVF